jgi:hypothetical protein
MKDTALKKIAELGEEAKSYATFTYEKMMTFSSDTGEKYRTFLSPDSNRYYSPLNPVFSFELETSVGNHLKSFEVVSLRDGVWPLLRFFALNPEPHEIDPILVIDSSLSSLVPPKWRDKTVLRKLFFEKELITKTRSKILILVSPDKKSCPLECIEQTLEEMAQKIAPTDEIFFYFSSVTLMGEEDAEKNENWGYQLLLALSRKFHGRKMHVLDWESFTSLSLSHFKYVFLNPLNFIFTDSYLLHNVSQRGAIPLIEETEPEASSDTRVNISINHGFSLHSRFDDYLFSNGKLAFNPSSIFVEVRGDDLGLVKLSTDDFKDWSYDVARELAAKSRPLIG